MPMSKHSGRLCGMLLDVITVDRFLHELATAVPESADLVSDHLVEQNGELLLHLLMAELQRMTVSTFQAGQIEVTDRLLALVARCLHEGDDSVVNAVLVSFIEDFGVHPGESNDLLERWPSNLRVELGR